MKKTILITNALIITMVVAAQTTKVRSYVDVGNVKALVDVNGYLWMNDST